MVQENDGEFSVKDIMNPNVVSLGPEASLKEASELMAQQKIGSIVIIETCGYTNGKGFCN